MVVGDPATERIPETSTALAERKRAIRRQVLAARNALDPVERVRVSQAITARLLRLPEFERARSVLAYLSFGSEFDTRDFVGALQARGCALVLPRIDRANHRLTLHRVSDPETETLAGVWGIREPDPARCAAADLLAIDAVLVPGVAFTSECERLGYGGGFYDALIRDWPGNPSLIAAAFELQMLDEVPVGPGDLPADAVVTQAKIYRRRAN